MPSEHLSKRYELDLETIRSNVLKMGGLVEKQFFDVMTCYGSLNINEAERIISTDAEVNKMEVSIDDSISHLIVKQQPAANDLRAVMATIKVITDLERIGDEITKIARCARAMHNRGIASVSYEETTRLMSTFAGKQLHDSLDAFARYDNKQAAKIIVSDDAIDYEYKTIMRNAIILMMEDPRTISVTLDTVWVAKAIERIGDHAKNIAEYVIYIVEGKDIRHTDYAALQRNSSTEKEIT